MFIVKKVSRKEYELNLLAAEHKIAPKVLKYTETCVMESEKYPETMLEYMKRNKITVPSKEIKEKIITQIKALHALGIVHTDLSEENVVINEEMNDIRIIDYGLAFFPAKQSYKYYLKFNKDYDTNYTSNKEIFQYDFVALEEWS